jgi:hypothetical protein
MSIPTIDEIARKLDLKRQQKAEKQGTGGGWTHIDEEETNALYALEQLSELESVKEGTRQVVKEMTEAKDKFLARKCHL